MEFEDKLLKCMDCGESFVFTAGEREFFHQRQFQNDPKRCKKCKLKRGGGAGVRAETRTKCSVCERETTVPFRPTQGRPVLCRSCFEKSRQGTAGSSRPESTGMASAGSSPGSRMSDAGEERREESRPG